MQIDKLEIKALMYRLKSKGITQIYCYYDGGGDSGEITEIDYKTSVRKPEKVKDAPTGEYYETGKIIDSHEEIDPETELDTPLKSEDTSLVEGWLYDVIADKVDEYGGDWCNNDGGYGSVDINVEDQTYDVHYAQRTIDECDWSDIGI